MNLRDRIIKSLQKIVNGSITYIGILVVGLIIFLMLGLAREILRYVIHKYAIIFLGILLFCAILYFLRKK